MTIDPETLMAYADGELGPIEAGRVERAIAADPALAAEVERHRRLNAQLRGGFAPVVDAPVPPAIAALLAGSAKVVPLAPRRSRIPIGWGGAIAASLCLGLFGGTLIPRGGIALGDDGALRGEIAAALGTQLASTQAPDAPVRIGVSFRDRQDALCRTFERGEVAGIACARNGEWQLQRAYGGIERQETQYRQAGSTTAAMMVDVQAMAAGEPLDAAAERQAVVAVRGARF